MFSSLFNNKNIHSWTTANVLALFMSWTSYSLFIPLHLLLIPSLSSSTVAAQLLNASSGIYSGLTVTYDNNVVRQYLGIEYARVHRRFDRATPVLRNSDRVIPATAFGPLCKPTAGSCTGNPALNPFGPSCSISYGIFAIKAIPTEQCLFLNVFSPVTKPNSGKKAIFMWIHGGSGQIGTGNLFDGTVLAALGDIIVVTFNFRLNLFGFLSSGDERLEGNLGLYDQALVLDWIYQNAPALGGDVRRITVGGHSAGAPHAYYLGVSPLNRGRIRRLVLQSGSPFNVWSHLKAHDAMEKFNAVANDNACGGVRKFEERLKCLQERDFDIVAEQEHHSYTSANHTNVVITGDFMSRFQENLEQNDTLTDVDILMGATDDEGKNNETTGSVAGQDLSSRYLRRRRTDYDGTGRSRIDYSEQCQFHCDRIEIPVRYATESKLSISKSSRNVSQWKNDQPRCFSRSILGIISIECQSTVLSLWIVIVPCSIIILVLYRTFSSTMITIVSCNNA